LQVDGDAADCFGLRFANEVCTFLGCFIPWSQGGSKRLAPWWLGSLEGFDIIPVISTGFLVVELWYHSSQIINQFSFFLAIHLNSQMRHPKVEKLLIMELLLKIGNQFLDKPKYNIVGIGQGILGIDGV
jgi:hypothetical protein